MRLQEQLRRSSPRSRRQFAEVSVRANADAGCRAWVLRSEAARQIASTRLTICAGGVYGRHVPYSKIAPTPPPSPVRKLPLEPQVRSRPYAIMCASEAILRRAAPFGLSRSVRHLLFGNDGRQHRARDQLLGDVPEISFPCACWLRRPVTLVAFPSVFGRLRCARRSIRAGLSSAAWACSSWPRSAGATSS